MKLIDKYIMLFLIGLIIGNLIGRMALTAGYVKQAIDPMIIGAGSN